MKIAEIKNKVDSTLNKLKKELANVYALKEPANVPNFHRFTIQEKNVTMDKEKNRLRKELLRKYNSVEVELRAELERFEEEWSVKRLAIENGYDLVSDIAKKLNVSTTTINQHVHKVSKQPNVYDAQSRYDPLIVAGIMRNPRAFETLGDCRNRRVADERVNTIKETDRLLNDAYAKFYKIQNREGLTEQECRYTDIFES